MAREATTTSASARWPGSCPMWTAAPRATRRRVASEARRSDPLTRYPRDSRMCAMALIPAPPMPMKWTRALRSITRILSLRRRPPGLPLPAQPAAGPGERWPSPSRAAATDPPAGRLPPPPGGHHSTRGRARPPPRRRTPTGARWLPDDPPPHTDRARRPRADRWRSPPPAPRRPVALQHAGAHGNAGHHRLASEMCRDAFMRHRDHPRPSCQNAVGGTRIEVLLLDHQWNSQDRRGRPDRRGRISARGDDYLWPPALQQQRGLRGPGHRQQHRPGKRPREPARPGPRGHAVERPPCLRHNPSFQAAAADKQDLRLGPGGDQGLGNRQAWVHVPPSAAPRDDDAHSRSPIDRNGETREQGNADIRDATPARSILCRVSSTHRTPVFPRSRVPAFPQYCEMVMRIPMHIIAKSSDDPPKLTKGSGTPVIGSTPVVTPILIMACSTIINVMLPATRLPYRSGASRAMRSPRMARMPNKTNTATVPTSPSSSPRIAKMKSVWRSGR